MEARPPFEPPAVPGAPPRGPLFAGVAGGFLLGFVPVLLAFTGLMAVLTPAYGAGVGILALAFLTLLVLLATAFAARRIRSDFRRGLLLGAALSLFLTAATISAIVWIYRRTR